MNVQTQAIRNNSAIHDTVNSVFVLVVYYHNPVNADKPRQTPKFQINYYLKYLDDKAYQGIDTELERVKRIIIKALRNDRNRPKTALLYSNNNKGRQLACQNDLFAKLVFKSSGIERAISPDVDTDGQATLHKVFDDLETELKTIQR